MKKLLAPALCAVILAGCAGKTLNAPTMKREDIIDLTEIYGKNEVFVIYRKDEKGNPLSIRDIHVNQADAIGYFKNSGDAIKKFDCIRISKAKINNQNVSVCDQPMWFGYGSKDLTILTTREAKSAGSAIVGGAIGAVLSPLSLAVDILSFDPKLSSTRKSLTNMVSDPVQDYDALNQVKVAVDALATTAFHDDKKAAMLALPAAKHFIGKYQSSPMAVRESEEIVRAGIERESANQAPDAIYAVMSSLPLSDNNREAGLSVLRGMGSFAGFARAFDVSGDVNDAKKAQQLASTAGDKRQLEYMAVKLVQKKRGHANDLFNIRPQPVASSDIRANRGNGFLFVESVNAGRADFSSQVEVSADNSAGIFAVGVYDVTVTATLEVRRHLYRRSFWLGNLDENQTERLKTEKTFRLAAPGYAAAAQMEIKDVLLNYKDRGSAGGTTEITLLGDPSMNFEVTNVKLVD